MTCDDDQFLEVLIHQCAAPPVEIVVPLHYQQIDRRLTAKWRKREQPTKNLMQCADGSIDNVHHQKNHRFIILNRGVRQHCLIAPGNIAC